MLKIFPYFLARVASSPMDEILDLRSSQIHQAIKVLYKLNVNIEIKKNKVCEAIFNVFKQVDNAKHQTILVTVKRNVFNHRDNSPEDLDLVRQYLSTEANSDLDKYLSLCREHHNQTTTVLQLFDQSLESNRLVFKQLVQQDSLYNGLLVAAPSLLNQTSNYLKKTSDAFRKKELQTELSLLKFLTRMYTKTTPFGTFTNIGIAQPQWLPNQSMPQVSFLSEVTSEVQVNNYLFLWLERELLKIKDIYFHLRLFVNHTLHVKGNQYLFYTNQDNREETFHKLEMNGLLEYIVDLINDQEDSWNLQTLIELLTEEADATAEELETYLKSLINVGLLEMTLIPSKKTINQAWELAQSLDKQIISKTPLVKEVIAQVDALHQTKEAYKLANFRGRKNLLKEAHHIAEGLFEIVKTNTPKKSTDTDQLDVQEILKANLFYEDTYRTAQLHINQNDFTKLLGKIDKLVNQCLHSKLRFFSLMEASSLFKTMYASDAEVDFLEFFEHYYIQIVQKEQEDLKQNPTFVELTNRYKNKWREIKKAWEVALAEGIAPYVDTAQEVVNLDSGIFVKTNNLNLPRTRKSKYYASFLQLQQKNENEPLLAFIHSITVGYSKMYSRFLNIDGHKEPLQEARLWNSQLLQDNELFIENQDESFANSNMHPALVPHQIQLKNTQKIPESTQPIALDELKVRFNQQLEEIELVHHQSGKLCRLFDLDFQAITGRSEMFKFLSTFDISEAPLYSDIIAKVNAPYIQQDKTYILPRIVFESQVVLQRKKWVIPHKLLPQKHPNTSPNEYFIKVNQWRQQQGIPHEVFVKLDKQILSESVNQTSKDLLKPQFIDFSSPLIFRIFEKLVKKIDSNLIIEETLPAVERHIPSKDTTFASELVIQWVSNTNDAEQ